MSRAAYYYEVQIRSTKWKRVLDLLPLLIHLRREEWEKLRALRERVEEFENHDGEVNLQGTDIWGGGLPGGFDSTDRIMHDYIRRT